MRIHGVAVFDGFSVVTICTDLALRPPTRTWWRVPAVTGQSCRELPFDEASLVIDIPAWR